MYTVYSIHYTLYIIHYTVYSIHYTLYSIQYTVYSIHYTVCSMQYALCSMQYAVCSMQYAVCSMQYALCSMQYAVCSSIQYTVYSTIHTLGYKIKSLTLLKRLNITKQTRVKLAGHAVPATWSQQDISTPFSILIEFGATEYSYSIRYSIRIRNFDDIRFDSNEIPDPSHP